MGMGMEWDLLKGLFVKPRLIPYVQSVLGRQSNTSLRTLSARGGSINPIASINFHSYNNFFDTTNSIVSGSFIPFKQVECYG